MDLVIALVVFFALIILPAFWRSKKNNKRRIVERIVLFLFLAWALFALRAFLR
jgi:hypothetical protein